METYGTYNGIKFLMDGSMAVSYTHLTLPTIA